MMFATNLKLDNRCSREQRVALIYEILEIFHLRQQADTLIASASGGELKRVRIALEMINNPSVLLLDEPVTGLDEFSAAQCLGLLKHLADCGRTVICSLHAPSARLSQLFNKIYAISSGECIYQGPVKYIVPFLKEFSLNCPITHNPVDFLIDVSIKTFGDFQYEMVEEIRNGKIASWFPKSAYANHRDFPNRNKFKMFDILENSRLMLNESSAYERSWWLEFRFILIRCLQQMWREKANVNLRLSAPILCSIVVGLAYYNVFRNSEHSLFTFLLPVTFTTEIVFLAMAPMVANVPQMIKFMRTEYFNQWYRLSSYYMAFLTAQLPYLFFMSIVCSVLIYFITGQPMELRRFILFAAITTLISLASSSYGLLVGSSFGIMHALFIGPMYTGIMLLFSYLSFGGADLSLFHKILMYSNFMRHALEGMLVPLFCLDRPDFPDPYDGAKFAITKPKYILKMFGSLNISYIRSVLVLGATTVVLCMLAFSILKYRLNVKRNSKSL
uniref:ABC transporter domain-containing protein n=1 Tax=Stomoxys calcitrans TaxID=35570 RepID=A0A1I8PT65_STOCA